MADECHPRSMVDRSARTEKSTLPELIGSATRQYHAQLNDMIVGRLPLALPPKYRDPRLLGRGIAAFARIYFEFEHTWDDLQKDPSATVENEHHTALRQWLLGLRPSGLPRTARLQNDIHHIATRTNSTIDEELPAQLPMLLHIRDSTHERPHLLVAYAWVMYMAIFFGGRWVRQEFRQAGEEFWTGEPPSFADLEKSKTPLSSSPGFSFLSFDGDRDGEDIKTLFQERLSHGESLLDDKERQDIVDASVRIFEDCIDLVGILDHAVGSSIILDRLRPHFNIGYGYVLLLVICVSIWFVAGGFGS